MSMITSQPMPGTSVSRTQSSSYSTFSQTGSRPRTNGTTRKSTGRPRTARPRTATTAFSTQQIICAVSESRGISPTVGLAFVNLDTCEVVLCQINDTQSYVRTIHKLNVFLPSEILLVSTSADPPSKLYSIIEEALDDLKSSIMLLHRGHYAENKGWDYIRDLAFAEDVEAMKVALSGNFYAVCSLAAALKFIEQQFGIAFHFHSLRMRYEPSEGSMMIDISTVASLELIQNLQNNKSEACLFGLMYQTQTQMGARLLRNNILQPLTTPAALNLRLDALEQLTTNEEMFFAIRAALKDYLDIDKLLTWLIIKPVHPTLETTEQSLNNIIMLRHFVTTIKPIFDALDGARSGLLMKIKQICAPANIDTVAMKINQVINEDIRYSKQPLDLRYQRTYAVKSGQDGFLDVSRTTFKENTEDAYAYAVQLSEELDMKLELKFDPIRQFYLRFNQAELNERDVPQVLINVIKKKDQIECLTLDLAKRNQKIIDSHNECLLLSDAVVQDLIKSVREHVPAMFKICESIAMLDMMSAFAQLATSQDYVRPQINDTLAVKSARHPIKEKIQQTKYVPNDIYATQQSRFQIITGCNMSGKSTYIRSIAMIVVMAQIGSFVPAEFMTFPIHHSLFARVSVDDSIEANVSTFAAEMREAAFILHNVDKHSLVIIDELGRGTSTRDGLSIAIAIAEALVDSKALVWFVTHFLQLPAILAERNGVRNLHLSTDLSDPSKLIPTYRITAGCVPETHYGIALARTVPLPHSVLDYATAVAEHLTQVNETNKKTSTAVLMQRKRRLILDLKEQLVQAKQARMPNEALKTHLMKLQASFIAKMAGLEEQLQTGCDVDMSRAAGDEVEGEADPATPVGRSQHEQTDQEMTGSGEGERGHVGGSLERSRSYRYGSSDLLQRS